ncbi:hypothetical protein WJX74_001788 [Apatococcus lobatus]|uniref:tRNA pseudouridine synthase n=1 Tax=Apatococcus lobatus TaxID=904363 RepID=A0AAW1S491_9CHLO
MLSNSKPAVAATGDCPAHKYLLTLAYKGTTYHGFQAQLQNHAGQEPREFKTVQSVVEKSLRRVTGSECRVVISVASRTDVGVHAKGQAATFYCNDAQFGLQMAALNLTLDRNIAVTDIALVPEAFNVARSVGKLYTYRLCDGAVQDPFQQDVQWWVADRWCQANARRPAPGEIMSLDLSLMQEAAACLQGQRCFAAFRDPSEWLPSNSVRHVWHIQVQRNQPGSILVEIAGDGFLYHMVRKLVAALVEVGAHRMSLQTLCQLRDQGAHKKTPKAAPAHGLCLERVFFSGDQVPFRHQKPA